VPADLENKKIKSFSKIPRVAKPARGSNSLNVSVANSSDAGL